MTLLDYFHRPAYLWLLLLLPALWKLSFRSLGGLGNWRRLAALAFRTAVYILLVFALAEMQFLRQSNRMTVIYLLDQSASIPLAQREAMVDRVKLDVAAHRDDAQRDLAALIVFGRNANIEVPPLDADLPIFGQLETLFDLRTDATNLAGALKLAQATFLEDSSRRIVIVTDGNENLGDAAAIARQLSEDGIGIDVLPVQLGNRPEVFVERIAVPSEIRKGQPFRVQTVVTNDYEPPPGESGEVRGTLRIRRHASGTSQTISEQPVVLEPGKNVYPITSEIETPNFYEYEAIFVPDDPEDDAVVQNNRATGFTQVSGAGQVLLIENWEQPGEFDYLIRRLEEQQIQVTVMQSNALFTSLAELQAFDAVILANVPRSAGDVANVTSFSDQQIDMLVRNTQEMGCGLIMLGGPDSFGAGGWTNTELEKAMPVDFQIHNAKVAPVGALAMVMHASEMARGNYWQKRIAQEALASLGPHDYCGVVHWTGKEEWLWLNPLGMAKVGPNKRRMQALLGRMTPGDMPNFDPSLQLAAASFNQLTDAAIKHMIIISDGDPTPASNEVLAEFRRLGVKATTVAVGTHGPAGHQELQRIATETSGKYYVVNNPQMLPRIFQREARRVARPLVKEAVVTPQLRTRHQILQGIESLPPIRGFVMTSVKKNPLVEVLLVSPEPANEANATLLATWTYDYGRTAVMTTDAGQRWADAWREWEGYDRLFGQLVRWAMRPSGEQGNFLVNTEHEDGRVRVTVTALDQDDQLLNFLEMNGSLIGPDMEVEGVAFEQRAPGRYEAEFDGSKSGSYFLSIAPGNGRTVLRSGINVPYSPEYLDRETNRIFLEQLAGEVPTGGAPGKIQGAEPEVNSFRRDLARAITSRDIWPLLVLVSSCVFFADVFVRRVHVHFDWVRPAWEAMAARVFGREVAPQVDERMERLRQRKHQIEGSLDSRRAATRFEPEQESSADSELLDPAAPSPQAKKPRGPASADLAPGEQEKEDYTSRLLRAKRDALRDKRPPEDDSRTS